MIKGGILDPAKVAEPRFKMPRRLPG